MKNLALNLVAEKYAEIINVKPRVLKIIDHLRNNVVKEPITFLEALKRERNRWASIYNDYIPEIRWLDNEIRYRQATAKPRHRA